MKKTAAFLGWETSQIVLQVLGKTFGFLFLNSTFALGESRLIHCSFLPLYDQLI